VFLARIPETDRADRHLQMRHDKQASGVDAGPEVTAELRRLANLFLLSSVTLALFLLRVAAMVLTVTFIPRPVMVAWGLLLLTGWAATCVYGLYTTVRARRWFWVVLCATPFTCVPASVAYAWIRRTEVEDEVLGPRPSGKSRAGRR
jgi:hypothetical protein